MQADSNVVSTLISSEQISEIATENRNFAALAALGLGVSSALPDSNTPTVGGGELHHQRQRPSSEPQHLADRRWRSG